MRISDGYIGVFGINKRRSFALEGDPSRSYTHYGYKWTFETKGSEQS